MSGKIVRLGLFGGTFDPVHNAHLFIAEAARVALGLDRVLFLPTKATHYRDAAQATTADRLAMLRAAIASNVRFAIDETDLAEESTGFTADLMPRMRTRYPADHLTFIVGGDSLLAAPWRRFDEVLATLDAFVIAPRAERPLEPLDALKADLPAALAAKISVLDLPAFAASATFIRAQLARGGSIRYVVPDPVFRYIEEHGLYRAQTSAHAD
jgi:nicotinate-nucleotide adenylyltransferase